MARLVDWLWLVAFCYAVLLLNDEFPDWHVTAESVATPRLISDTIFIFKMMTMLVGMWTSSECEVLG